MTDHQCSHRLGDGRPCGSPRQANKSFCFYHNRVHESFVLPGNRHYNPPPLTDFHHITIALTHVWSALAKSMITHKQACAMAYQIQLAKQTLNDILKVEQEMKESGTHIASSECAPDKCGTDIPVGECGEAAPALTDDSTPTDPYANTIHYDSEHPPLALEPALRPLPSSPIPAADSLPTFIPISEKEFEWMNKYMPQGLADPTPDIILRRRLLNVHFKDCPTPPPDEIAKILFEFDENQARRVKEREDAMRTIRAKQRDLRNQQILGY
jgi:hypothetical protein